MDKVRSKARVSDHCEAQVIMGSQVREGIRLGGRMNVWCIRDGKEIWRENIHNIVTTEGQNFILTACFKKATTTVPTTWFMGLVNTNTTPDIAMNYDVPVFTESVAYDNIAVRATYTVANAASATITNTASPASFTMSGTETIYGAALFSINTRGDHTALAWVNILYCYAKFSTGRAVVDNDVINATYETTTVDDAV